MLLKNEIYGIWKNNIGGIFVGSLKRFLCKNIQMKILSALNITVLALFSVFFYTECLLAQNIFK